MGGSIPRYVWYKHGETVFEGRLVNREKATDVAFTRRHALVSATEGYAFPSLQLMPSGERVRLV